MADAKHDVLAIFTESLARETAEERLKYLDEACQGSPQVRDRVETLLRAHADAGNFLGGQSPVVAATIDVPPLAELPGTQIGPYKLLEQIGEGGMGVVYHASQREPVRRTVALKIIKPGMDSREVIRRFEAERQALALMDHPNIAKVLDAGATESGRPYFVMELVNGVPITQYCDDNDSTMRQRLELFTLVCHAVQHAHQKGIIHRDIKPSNILVTLHDGVPVPKVIDFGIAKAIHQELTSQTMATGVGHMLGTPLYMSPEQAERSGLDIDTRSDIYSLGVLLYELLTGSTPFASDQFKDVGLDEVRRLIREQEPPRPSTRISTMGKLATTVSEHRRTNPVELSNSLRHELDWIVMKALEKDRTRRYESANDFARDIQRYLHDEAVEACPPSTAYRLKKFVRRNRAAALSTAAIGLALILGAGVAAGQAYRATKAEKVAEEQLQIAQHQERLAKQQTQLAKKQAKLAKESAQRERDLRTEAEAARKQSEAVTSFLVDIFRSPDPERDGRTITVAEMLDKAKMRVETEFKEDKVLQAKLLGAIGETYVALGLEKQAIEVAQQAYDIQRALLGPEHIDTLLAMERLSEACLLVGRVTDALRLSEEALTLRKRVLGPTHPYTLASMNNVGLAMTLTGRLDEGLVLLEEALKLRTEILGREHPDTLGSMQNVAAEYADAGRWEEATELYERALQICRDKLGSEHPLTLMCLGNLAGSYHSWKKLDRSIPLYEEAVALRKKVLGEHHPSTLHAQVNLAINYGGANQLDKAVLLLEETLQNCKDKLGAEHPTTLMCMLNLGRAYVSLGRWDEGLSLLEETLLLQKKRGLVGEDVLRSMSGLAAALQQAGRVEQAVPLLEEIVVARKKELGPEHYTTRKAVIQLAQAHWHLRQLNQSIPMFEEVLRIQKAVEGEDHPSTLSVMADLGGNYVDAGRLDEAIPLLDKTLARCREKLGPAHPTTLTAMNNLGMAYLRVDRAGDALPLLEETLAQRKTSKGPDNPGTLLAMNNTARAYAALGRFDDALQLNEESHRLLQEKLGPAHPSTLTSLISLGNVHVQRNEFATAEPLLLEAYHGFAKRLAAAPTPYDDEQVQTVMTDLVQLYEKSNQPDKAKEWQEKLDALKSQAKPENNGSQM